MVRSKNQQSASDGADAKRYAELWGRPGYLVRRLHQIHIGLFAEEVAGENITPVQYGLLSVLYAGAAMDQRSLSNAIGIDRKSGSEVIKRLSDRGLLSIEPSDEDRRAKIIRITQDGVAFVDRIYPAMQRAQERMISPLTERQQAQFLKMIIKLVKANNDASRAPMD